MPQVGRIEVSIMEEDQARLLAFQNDELDLMNMEAPLAPNVLDGDKLRPEFAKKGIKLSRIVDPEISYVYWNMQDPIVGGMSQGEDRAAARDGDGVQRRRRDQRRAQRPGGRAAIPDPAGRRRPRSRITARRSSTTRRAPTRCSTTSATRRAPTAGATCRTASRSPSAMRRVPTRSAGSWTSCGKRRSTASACGWRCRRTSFRNC